MKISLDLPTDTSIGLRRLANEQDIDLEAAATIALREFLIMGGWIEVEPEIDEGMPTAVSA